MSEVLPLRCRRLGENQLLFADEAGRFFRSDDAFAVRLLDNDLSSEDRAFLSSRGLLVSSESDLNEMAFLHSLARRIDRPGHLSYVILVPSLRCDLSCSYCQVSRASETAIGYDWSEATLAATLSYLDREGGDSIQIEFQGGEPSLRMDLVEEVARFARKRFTHPRFVICTNLSRLDHDLLRFIANEDVLVSTSLDGPAWLHRSQRTGSSALTDVFFSNLRRALEIAPGRVHALPTLNVEALPDPSELLDAFEEFGLRSLYLRPVTYHGFARKRHPSSVAYDSRWASFYEDVVAQMIARNADLTENHWEEFYLSTLLKRLMKPGESGHIDLRSPNWLGYDHLVIDYDGRLYPTDEARMLARSGQIDLSLGDVSSGIDEGRRRPMQSAVFNCFDPWCSRCPYQAACGADPIDDLARHGFVNPPRPSTAFCQRHLHLFDIAMQLIYSPDRQAQRSVARWLDLPAEAELGAYHA
jgi:His-Xaa-Ser system radical SAM maturase HxsB